MLVLMLRINWVNYERNPYCGFWEIQFQRKNVSCFRSTIGRGRGSWIAYFFGSNHSLIVIVCNCDESFCVWFTEIIHSSNFLKSAICVRDFQGIVRDYLNDNPGLLPKTTTVDRRGSWTVEVDLQGRPFWSTTSAWLPHLLPFRF